MHFFERLAHRLVRNGIDDPLLNQRIFQEMQAPAFVAVGRGAAHQGDEVGFACAVKQANLALLLFLTTQTEFQAAHHKALTDTINGEQTNADLGGNFGICFAPAFLRLVSQKQDAGAVAFSLGAALGFAPTGEFLALGLG